MLLKLFADRPLHLADFFTLIQLLACSSACSSACSKNFDRKQLQSLLFFRFKLLRRWKDKKNDWRAVHGPVSFFKPARHVYVLPNRYGKSVIYRIAVLVVRKVKILQSNSHMVVSPLQALISGQLESCQRFKLKAVKIKCSRSCSTMTIKWRNSKKPKCFTAVRKPWKTSDPSRSF